MGRFGTGGWSGVLLKKEAESDRPLYEDVRARAIEFARVRVVQEPVTEYLRYELMSYRIRATMGENIEVLREPSGTPLPNGATFDFLLFDRRTALVHDYGNGPTGVQAGGWLVRDPRTVGALEERALALRAGAVPFERFLAQADF
ncbi:DUF6879 family protein [Streptomonospora halophila]|uniref:DUF6879 family protein n=1 Tax=Streptomonospora halophila TaxID=427369 RepID=UPI0031E7DB92